MLKNNYKCHIAFNNNRKEFMPNSLHLNLHEYNETLEGNLYKHVFKQNLLIKQNKCANKNKTVKKH